MSERASDKKKRYARDLYFAGFTQEDIGDILGYAHVTIGRWAQKGKWSKIKIEREAQRINSEEHLLKLITYQLKALKQRTDKYLEEEKEDALLPLIESKEMDGLSKMLKHVQSSDASWQTYIKIVREFTEYVSAENIELAKTMTEIGQRFLNEKSKTL